MTKKKKTTRAKGLRPHIKTFEGKTFRFDSWYTFKTDAKKRAKSLRQGKNVKARVFPHTKLGKYIVYVRRGK